MQILGKRSKVLLIVIAIVMLLALGVSFAIWDTSTVNATNGNLSNYANAKVGDIIEFGRYYQTGEKVSDAEDAEYEKTPIEWIVVDKDERTGQITLMSKYILATGSYFGNWYHDGINGYNWNYNKMITENGTSITSTAEVGDVPNNQAYVESTARAFLNNLERFDMGGDKFDATVGYIPSGVDSTIDSYDTVDPGKFVKGTGLLSSVGFSNQRYWTNLTTTDVGVEKLLADTKSGLIKRYDENSTEVYYKRPIMNKEFAERPVTRGFLDEAFYDMEKSMIVPKQIAGYIGHRWPDSENDPDSKHNIATKSYVEGALDKVWLPSVTELNIMNGEDWNNQSDDSWTNPSDEAGSTVFQYFKNYKEYNFATIADAVKAERTTLAKNGMIGNFSIPVYDKGTTTQKTEISTSANTSDEYWTRSPGAYWCHAVRIVQSSGEFGICRTRFSHLGVRPCIILKY